VSGWRVVQRGRGPLVACYLVGDQCDPDLRAALPGAPVVATAEAPLTPTRADLDRARTASGANDETVLVGFSAGCQSVRAHLLAGVDARAVVCADGTHASVPPAPWQIQVWKSLVEKARRGECVFAASCTQMTYVERIAVGQPGRATSTRHVLEQASGEILTPGSEMHDGGLHLLSCPSADVDHDAHVAQQRVTMPEMLRRFVAPALGEAPAPSTKRSTDDPGWMVLAEAEADLTAGIREHGHNAGPEIEELYLKPMGLPPGSSYCAAAVCSWIRRARSKGALVPITGAPGAKATMAQLDAAKLWTPKKKLWAGNLRPGNLLVWDRSDPSRPETAWQGHIGIVVAVGREVVWTIEANADRPLPCDAVCMLERRLDEPRLLGAGRLS
jgi:hypothetical protein